MYGVALAVAALVVLWSLRKAGRLSPDKQKAFTSKAAGYGLCLLGGFFALKGLLVVAVPLLGLGAGLIGWQGFRLQKPTAPQPSSSMDRAEALAVLGVGAHASSEDIRAAHKNLLRNLHPDAGGSTYLAAKINAARDLLLK